MRSLVIRVVAVSILALFGAGTAFADDRNAGSMSMDNRQGEAPEPSPWGYREPLKVGRPAAKRTPANSRDRRRPLPLSPGDDVGGRTPATPGVGWLVLLEVSFSPREAAK